MSAILEGLKCSLKISGYFVSLKDEKVLNKCFIIFQSWMSVNNLKTNLSGCVVLMCHKYCFIRTLFHLGRSA